MFVYAIKTRDQHARVKIGVSDNPFERLAQLQTGNPLALEIVHACYFKDSRMQAFYLEKQLHIELSPFRIANGGTEWFSFKALKYIKKLAAKPPKFWYKNPACIEFYQKRIPGDSAAVRKEIWRILNPPQ